MPSSAIHELVARYGAGARAPYLFAAIVEGRGPRRAARILVVEDDYFIALDLEQQLMEAGYDVVGIAASADDATRIAAAEKPDIAIMDIRLVGPRDGVDAAIALAETFGVPSIFATAHGDAATRARAERAKPAGWLLKPYSSVALLDLLKRALG